LDSATGNRFLNAALRLQAHGFRIFLIAHNTKDGTPKEFPEIATADPERAKAWWVCPVMGTEHHHNIGIACSSLANGERLVGVDIDNKEGRDGDLEVLRLELEGKDFPETYEQFTPTGGRHLVYRTSADVANSRSHVARGIDIRGRGGYLVGAGSEIDGAQYEGVFRPIAEAPEWLIEACRAKEIVPGVLSTDGAKVDSQYAYRRGEDFIASQEGVPQGRRGSTAYAHACRLKDFGVSEYCAFEILESWAERCEPPMPLDGVDGLIETVAHAYKYGKNKPGSAAPEMSFGELPEEKKLSPIGDLNKEHAFIIVGGKSRILWETVDEEGAPTIEHLSIETFHQKFAARTMVGGGGKFEPVTELWMKSPNRRSYDGMCFRPEQPTPKGFYNVWRGFTVKPAGDNETFPSECHEALKKFKDHMHENICSYDRKLSIWLTAWFAHLVQRPWQKPHTAIVLKGRKGVGKSVIIDRIGALFGPHYLAAADRRYLVGNFNSHMQKCAFINLEEAFWSGDKSADGILKHLVTGEYHQIEYKGLESFRVRNITRVAIIGNEDWLVPASADERRFAVFNVSDKRIQDVQYFRQMQEGMEKGGYRLLLRYLQDFDISQVELNHAPATAGLLDQKLESLGPVHQWWYECLTNGEFVSSPVKGWSAEVPKDIIREAFTTYCRNRQIRSRIPEERGFGRALCQCSHAIKGNAKMKMAGEFVNAYTFPELLKARKDFERFIGHEVSWE
jgi:hypothetical protein